jgi:hypothetical protein
MLGRCDAKDNSDHKRNNSAGNVKRIFTKMQDWKFLFIFHRWFLTGRNECIAKNHEYQIGAMSAVCRLLPPTMLVSVSPMETTDAQILLARG